MVGIILATITSIILVIAITSIVISSSESKKNINLKTNSILKIDLTKNKVVERNINNPLKNFNASANMINTIELKQILDNISKAKTDDKIKGIYINTSIVNAGLSQMEEIRNELLNFKKSGKKIIAYSEVYSQSAYYLASVANKIYLNPKGGIELTGLSATIMFFTGLFEKLDIDVQIIKYGKFKSAVEPFSLEKMSTENRKQMKLLLNSYADNMMDSIGSQRNLPLSTIQEDASKLNLNTAEDCLELSYVDALLYEDQIKDSLKLITEEDELKIINITKYTNINNQKEDISRNKIAIIYATGSINMGEGDEENIGAETTAKAIENARKDKNVKAIVFRINSGGGSALASEVIWRETLLAKKEKPFVVSMGDYAASGGYYIACAADSIVANPLTLTGSIGVFGMIPNLQKFYKNKLGITLDTVNTNRYADMGMNRPLYNFEKNKIQNNINNVYDTFITRVGSGRNMTKAAVDEIGQGRVWTGYDAKKIGLIDVYGGINKSIEIAAKLSKIEEFRIITLPKKKDPFEELSKNLLNNTNIYQKINEFIGINSRFTKPIEDILKKDPIQAQIPFVIELKQ